MKTLISMEIVEFHVKTLGPAAGGKKFIALKFFLKEHFDFL